MKYCEICKHLMQYHLNSCLVCSLMITETAIDWDKPLDGYCGKDNLRYLEYMDKISEDKKK